MEVTPVNEPRISSAVSTASPEHDAPTPDGGRGGRLLAGVLLTGTATVAVLGGADEGVYPQIQMPVDRRVGRRGVHPAGATVRRGSHVVRAMTPRRDRLQGPAEALCGSGVTILVGRSEPPGKENNRPHGDDCSVEKACEHGL